MNIEHNVNMKEREFLHNSNVNINVISKEIKAIIVALMAFKDVIVVFKLMDFIQL